MRRDPRCLYTRDSATARSTRPQTQRSLSKSSLGPTKGLLRIRGGTEGQDDFAEFVVQKGEAISAAHLRHGPALRTYSGHRIPGILRSLGARQPGNRVPVAVPLTGNLNEQLQTRLDTDPAVLAGDPTWLCLADAVIEAGQESANVYLLTEQQVDCLRGLGGGLGSVKLPNDQNVNALILMPGQRERPLPLILAKQPFCPAGISYGEERGGWWPFQSQPASDFRSIIPSAHAFHVVLHESFQEFFPKRQHVVIRNFGLEERYPSLDTRFPLRHCFSSSIEPNCAAVEETALIACGIREGEPCWLSPLATRWWTPFAYRHVVARVGPVATVDQDKPLCRVPQSVLDVLGATSGELVQLETLSLEDEKQRILRNSYRLLPEREDQGTPPLRGGAPDFFEEVGSVDLPMVRLDGRRQKELSVSRGSAVYIRPRVFDYLTRQASAVGLVFAGGIVAIVANDDLLVAILLISGLVALAMILALRGIRR